MSDSTLGDAIDRLVRYAREVTPPIDPAREWMVAVDADRGPQVRLYRDGKCRWRGTIAQAVERVVRAKVFDEAFTEAAALLADLAKDRRHLLSYYVLFMHPDQARWFRAASTP